MPILRFTGANGWGSADRFAQFVDHLLHLRCAAATAAAAGAPLDSCDFDFDSDGFLRLPAREHRAGRWIRQAVTRARALRIRVADEDEPSPLSDHLHLVSQHLTRLELIGVGVKNSIFDLSACPALLQLNMEDCEVLAAQLLSPSLKHLRIAHCHASDYYRILLSLPSLVSLELIGFGYGRIPLLGSLPRLATAVVVLEDSCTDQCSQGRFDDCGAESETCGGCSYYFGDPEFPDHGPPCDRNTSIFLKGLSEATELELSAASHVVFDQKVHVCVCKYRILEVIYMRE